MLDDLKYIHSKDKNDALGVAEKQWQQLIAEPVVINQFHTDHVYNVVLSGMGGSALAAQLFSIHPGIKEPFEISRGYSIPNYVDADTLFIASSYSGNTEETLASLEAAEQKGAQIAVITSGGKLVELAEQKNYALYKLPSGLQPRYATFYAYRLLLELFTDAGMVDNNQLNIEEASSHIKKSVEPWLPTVPTSENPAKKLAQELVGLSPVIYSSSIFYPAAYKWKISINENAKNIAWCNQFPEFNHNEFLGWSSHPIDKPYRVVILKSRLDNERILKRFSVTERMLSGRWPAPIHVEAAGDTVLEQLLWMTVFGDFVSLYLALLNGIDPTPVELIEKFKLSLSN